MRTGIASLILIVFMWVSYASGPPGGGFGDIAGRVSNAKTMAPLGFANVVVVGTTRGAMTLDDGRFTIKNVPVGTYTVRVMMMGYKSFEYRGVEVRANETTELVFRLEETIVAETQAIEVSGARKAVDVPSVDVRSGVTQEQVREMPVDMAVEGMPPGGNRAGTRGESNRKVVTSAIIHNRTGTGNDLHVRGGRGAEQTSPISGSNIRWAKDPFNTESYDPIRESPFLAAIDNPVSTFSIDVDAASYSNVRRFVSQGILPPKDAVRIEEMLNYFRYDYAEPEGEHPFSITTEVAECPWDREHRLVHIGLQGKRVALEDLPPNNLVFLLDVSGSMQPPNKLPLLKKAFRLLVDNLRPQDRVAIAVYAGDAGMALPSTRGGEKGKILDAIDQLRAGGCTAGAAGIRLAYQIAEENFMKKGNNRVILATDGDFNIGVSNDGELVRLIEEKRKSGVFLSILGFGQENLKDSKMEKIADAGNGHYAYVDNILEARKVLVLELGATLLTIAKDVKIQIEFNPAKVNAYRLVGYENRLLRREDFDDDKKDAGELGAGHSVTALYEIVPAGDEVAEKPSELKYVQVSVDPRAYESSELLTVRFRYKPPKKDESVLINQTVVDAETRFGESSADFRFAAAVAQFGMLLRESEFKGDSSFEGVIETARNALGEDQNGYRGEFVRLVETCALLAKE